MVPPPASFLGIDVAKGSFDVSFDARPGPAERYANEPRPVGRLVRRLRASATPPRLIQDLIDGDDDLRARQAKLLSVKGVGPRVSRVLVSELPEPGRIDRRKAAALVGVAPFNDDSGKHQGRRTIRGGRATVRPRCTWRRWSRSGTTR